MPLAKEKPIVGVLTAEHAIFNGDADNAWAIVVFTYIARLYLYNLDLPSYRRLYLKILECPSYCRLFLHNLERRTWTHGPETMAQEDGSRSAHG